MMAKHPGHKVRSASYIDKQQRQAEQQNATATMTRMMSCEPADLQAFLKIGA